ncbi:GNAT family N-acetyltransferase [Clostridium sp. CCUG 7971]|uniref:GNAT family N-acetyltransferase n=1 Tax=Clostridium sp. CCUG 7971 TaxID=2811414 RepID=UPI001ABBA548|nr:GNAT family N-acetyltransferase [Clostridium sp. CCUG 7971]MBO3444619.1 GNAT family N-acetyltransferase [Clostridium sp. CCUG 7971]
MNIEIKKVNDKNLEDILKLRINENQNSYIESTEECLKESDECKFYEPAGLYIDGMLVGFAMYGFFPREGEDGRVWLDRFLIDKKYQGEGLGSIMLDNLIKYLSNKYKCNKIFLSLYENNTGALHLYKKFGFEFNGELDINEEKIMVKKL